MNHKKPIPPILLERARNMRKLPTPPENKLWQRLRRKQIKGYKFRRQHVIGRYITDFYCHEAKLIIEVDGASHTKQQQYDAERTAWLEEQGHQVIRFWNNEVMQNMDGVLTTIMTYLPERKDD